MNVFLRVCRRVKPKLYIRIELAKLHKALNGPRRINISTNFSKVDPHERIGDEIDELNEWAQSIDDRDLQAKAKKIGVYIEDIECPKIDDDARIVGYYEYGAFGNELLRDDIRKPLSKAVREREPIYKKERRERLELYLKLITAIAALLGGLIGLVSVLKR
jgi:hypothetical protein